MNTKDDSKPSVQINKSKFRLVLIPIVISNTVLALGRTGLKEPVLAGPPA